MSAGTPGVHADSREFGHPTGTQREPGDAPAVADRVVLRTPDETLAGNVLVWGKAGRRRLLGRAGSFDVYRRIGISYRLIGVSHRLFTVTVQSLGSGECGEGVAAGVGGE